MKKLLCSLVALGFLILSAPQINAQIETPAPSPAAEVEQMVGLTDIQINYARPSVKGRTIFAEDGLVPYGKVWRFGANAATKFAFDKDVMVGGAALSGGEYAVLAKPSASEWTLMFYPYESWSWNSYVEKEAAATVTVKPEQSSVMVEQMRFTVDNITMTGADIVFAWDKTLVKIPVTVHTEKQVDASIKSVMAGPKPGDYYAAASYYHEMGKDLDKALEWITIATDVKEPRYWQVRRKALILGDLGKKDEAIKAAKLSLELAEKAGNDDYVRMNKASIAEWSK
ncbi:MAG: DUF2911 domain-containing protein [Mameliella sp.]|nr:DUF2911 domain-containing protein [Phaeodactylibacter sp.]NRA51841.1 DUF2911 domain-containing protein [Phaeodactylibacter sp.]